MEKPGLGSVPWLSVCVYALKGVTVITWPAAHLDRNRHKACAAAGHSRGDGMKVVCLYDVALVKCHNVSCRVCKRVPEAAGRIESLHKVGFRRLAGT